MRRLLKYKQIFRSQRSIAVQINCLLLLLYFNFNRICERYQLGGVHKLLFRREGGSENVPPRNAKLYKFQYL
jgi:hypothetical protein